MADETATPLERGAALSRDEAIAQISGVMGSSEEPNPRQDAEATDDNPEAEDTAEAEEVQEGATDEEAEGEELEADDEADDAESEDDDAEPQTYKVKVNGEEREVGLEELRNGYQRHQDYQEKMGEVSKRQAQLEELGNAAERAISERLQQADSYLAEVAKVLGVEQEPDWENLRQTLDPDEYRFQRDQWDDNQRKLQRLAQQRSHAMQQQQQEQSKRFNQYVAGEVEKIKSEWPEFADEKKRPAVMEEMFTYLDGRGFTREESANLIDSRQIAIVRDAMAYRKLQDGKPEITKKVRKAPKVSKSTRRARPKDQSYRASLDRAKQTGRREDFMDAIAAWRTRG